MPTHHRKLGKNSLRLAIGAVNFECQVQTWNYDHGIGEGERMYSFCPADGGFIEEPAPEPTLEVTFYSDWRSNGITDFLFKNAGSTADFTIDVHPDRASEHVQLSGQLRIAPAPIGGEAQTTETLEVTFQVLEPATYTRVGS